ncbi:MAG: FliH/SctL family protein [Planctomycetota bacterium]|jgi:flagellar assembly protein FliH
MPASLTIQLAGPIAGVRAPHEATSDDVQAVAAEQAVCAGEVQQQVQQELNAAMACIRSANRALEDAHEQFRQVQQEALAESEQQVVELALEVARKVLMQEIQAQRYDIDPIIREALLHVPVRHNVVCRLNPQDLTTCEMARKTSTDGHTGEIRFIGDPTVPPASCVLETHEGVVRSSVEGHLEEISKALEGEE